MHQDILKFSNRLNQTSRWKSQLKFLVPVLALVQWLFLWNTHANQDVYLKVQSGSFHQLAILIFPFENEMETDLSEDIRQVIINDLYWTGFFQVLNKDVNPEYPVNEQNTNNWETLPEVSTMLEGTLEAKNNQLVLKMRLMETPGNKIILDKKYTGEKISYRTLAHQIADDIVYMLIGIPGIAQTRIAYVSKKGTAKELNLVDYDGFGQMQLTNTGSISLSPNWSPDQPTIAFTSYHSSNPDLYLIQVDQKKLSKFSSFDGLNSAPSWSPDGKQIALTLSKDGNPEIYTMEIKNRHLRRLTFFPGIDTSPSWSPTNREIAFTSDRSGSPQIYIMDAEGTNVRRLTWEGNYNVSPAWSPRGDRIAFVSREENAFHIYSIDINSENLIRLTEQGSRNEDPAWSPNGLYIVFSSNRENKSSIYVMRWDGTNVRRITDFGENSDPSWSPLYLPK